MGKIQIEESEHTRLVEEAGRVDALAVERDTEKERADRVEAELAEARRQLEETGTKPLKRTSHQVVVQQLEEQQHEISTLKARERARDIVAEEMTEAWVAPSTVARLTTELLSDLPLVEGKLDEIALRGRCVESRDRAELEAAETLDAAGFGKPRGLGASTPPASGDSSKYTDAIAEGMHAAFGVNPEAAKLALEGR